MRIRCHYVYSSHNMVKPAHNGSFFRDNEYKQDREQALVSPKVPRGCQPEQMRQQLYIGTARSKAFCSIGTTVEVNMHPAVPVSPGMPCRSRRKEDL